MPDSTKRRRVRKPATKLDPNWRHQRGLNPAFPLFPHQSGRWAKKVRGKLCYFGKTADDPKGDAAILLWLEQKDALLAGRKPRQSGDFVTVKQVVNTFYNDKLSLVESGELSPRTLDEYATTGKLVAKHLGTDTAIDDLTPDDFKRLRQTMARKWGPVRLGNEIQRVRMIFRHSDELLAKPVQFGKQFRKPAAKVTRLSRAERGPRDIAATDIKLLLETASPNMKAMILLGINGGLGPTDLATLKTKSTDLENGWLKYPRQKTGIARKIPLWPETVSAIRDALKSRKQPKNETNADLLFISPQRKSYFRDNTGKDGEKRGARAYGLSHEFKVARVDAGLPDSITFYDLRRTFQTIAEGAHDLSAVQSIMGHAASTNDMSAVYRQRVSDERLLAVTSYVRTWLYG